MNDGEISYQEWRAQVHRTLLLYDMSFKITDFEEPGDSGEESINLQELFDKHLTPDEAAEHAVTARKDLSRATNPGQKITNKAKKK